MGEIKPCPFCGNTTNYKTYGEWCAEIKPDDPRSEILNSWRQSAYEQNKRIAELERMIKTVDENLLEAVMSVDLYFGNDTPGVMADIIMSLRKRIAELESAQRWIPVSERPPQIGVRVLFYNNFTKNIHKGWYSGDEWTSDIGVFYNGDKLKRITHWMPLPEPPNDTQKDTVVYGKDSKPIPCPFCGEIMRSVRDEQNKSCF